MSKIDRLIEVFREVSKSFPDRRRGRNLTYKCPSDFAMGAFSVFFTQNESFLARQKELSDDGNGVSNCQTLFGMEDIPSDNAIRSMLDCVDPKLLTPVFDAVLSNVVEEGVLGRFQTLGGRTMVAIDATEYHSSYKIHCAHCSHRLRNNGEVQHFHSMVSPALVGHGHDHVIALPPAFIVPQDGHEKQDCEPVAAQRWLREHAQRMRALRPVYLGDDIYSRQPMCEAVLATGADFIFVAKDMTHKLIYEYLDGAEHVPTLSVAEGTGAKRRLWVFRWLDAVPLRDGDDALEVNFVEARVFDNSGRQTYHNAWVTNLDVTEHNVADIAAAGRARWKVENGNYNTLKTKGYNLEHNFGHGKRHLSTVLACMNLLAFSMHTLMMMVDEPWQNAMKRRGTRKNFFDKLRAVTFYFVLPSWDSVIAKITSAHAPIKAA